MKLSAQKDKDTYGKIVINTILSLTREGKTNREIASILGITNNMLLLWLRSTPNLQSAVEDARDFLEAAVEQSLLSLAVGYSHDETKVFCDKYGNITEHTIKRHYPPHFNAIQFLLKNLKPEKWKDKQEVTINSADYTVKNIAEAVDIISRDPALLSPPK